MREGARDEGRFLVGCDRVNYRDTGVERILHRPLHQFRRGADRDDAVGVLAHRLGQATVPLGNVALAVDQGRLDADLGGRILTAWAIVATNGTAIVEVMIQMCLPLSLLMSKASPGATNVGFSIALATIALASASPSAFATGDCPATRMAVEPAIASAAIRRRPAPRTMLHCLHVRSPVGCVLYCRRSAIGLPRNFLAATLPAHAAWSRATKRAKVTAMSRATPLNISCTHDEVPSSSSPITPVTSR